MESTRICHLNKNRSSSSLKKFQDTLKFQFKSQRELQVESDLIDEQIRLIEKQLVIAEKDKASKMIPSEKQLTVDDSLCKRAYLLTS